MMDHRSCSRKRKRAHQRAVSRIDELPDALLIHILCLLDDMKDAVKTSLLSKRWKNLWTYVDSLVFRYASDTENPSWEQVQPFENFVDHILSRCVSPKINKFCVTIQVGRYMHFRFSKRTPAHNWLEFAVKKNVPVVKLGWKEVYYEMPACFFSNSSFVSLEIDMYSISIGFKWSDINWNTLRSLLLKSLFLDDHCDLEKILSGCPVLETMILDNVGGHWSKINITSQSVRELKLLNLIHICDLPESYGYVPVESDYYDTIFDITAPWVEKLEVSGCCSGVRCNLISVPSLKSANLTLRYLTFEPRVVDRDFEDKSDYYAEPEHVWFKLIECLLHPVRNVDELVVGPELLQALSLSKLLDGKPLILNCKSVTLQSPICIHEIPGIVSLLEFSPYLETLKLKLMPWKCHFSTYEKFGENRYIKYIENVFSSFHGVNFLSEQKAKIKCLKNMKIDCTEKLNYSAEEKVSSKDMCFEFEVVAHIIKNAPILDKLVISSSRSDSPDFAKRYIELLSSEVDVGDKAVGWDLKERKFTWEFSF